MNFHVVTVYSHEDAGLGQLVRSLDRFGWDYTLLKTDWLGFGTKIIETGKYAADHPDTHIVFLDAYDTFVLGGPEELRKKMWYLAEPDVLFSAEKNCWPDHSLMGFYEPVPTPWKFLNSGSYIYLSNLLSKELKRNPPKYEDDDQLYFTKSELYGGDPRLDHGCSVFQSIAFPDPGDFTFTYNRLKNNITQTFPIFIHGNGKTDMTEVYKCLK
jgi:hypothetical protein